MTEDAIFKEQWSLLKKEMAMGDAHLQQRLEQFIFRQYGRAVLAHYIKALSALELSRHFYLRFRRRSRSVTEPILYWTVLAETTIHMTLEGVKDMHPFISLPACAGATFQLDMLKDCYLLYLRDREYPCWPRASRRRRIIRNKWNAPPFFSGRRSAAIPPSAAPFVKQALKHPRFFQKIFEKPPGCYRISMQSP